MIVLLSSPPPADLICPVFVSSSTSNILPTVQWASQHPPARQKWYLLTFLERSPWGIQACWNLHRGPPLLRSCHSGISLHHHLGIPVASILCWVSVSCTYVVLRGSLSWAAGTLGNCLGHAPRCCPVQGARGRKCLPFNFCQLLVEACSGAINTPAQLACPVLAGSTESAVGPSEGLQAVTNSLLGNWKAPKVHIPRPHTGDPVGL